MLNATLWFCYTLILLGLWRSYLWRPRGLPNAPNKNPLLLGHRGVRGPKPENTTEAFLMALNAKLDGVEVDVQQSRDHVLILHHDFALKNQTVTRLTHQDILKLDPQVPTLNELFDIARDFPIAVLNIEIKAAGWRTDGLERRVAQQIRHSGLAGRVIVSSFNPVSLVKLRLADAGLRVGLLFAPDMPVWLRSGWLAGWLHVDAVHPHESQVTHALMERAKVRNLTVNTWTVNDPMRVTSLIALGVNGIIADNPADLLNASRQTDEEDIPNV